MYCFVVKPNFFLHIVKLRRLLEDTVIIQMENEAEQNNAIFSCDHLLELRQLGLKIIMVFFSNAQTFIKKTSHEAINKYKHQKKGKKVTTKQLRISKS